jgi:ElaB/YqjD/DUF883 family membrane-anchored ribosome-binding protein
MKTTVYTNTPTRPDHLPAGDGVLNKAAIGAHGVVNKVAGAADEAARKVIPAIDRAAEYAHQTVDKAVTGVTPAAEWLNEKAAALDVTQKKLVSSTREYVAANPLQSLGLALAAGFLISRIVRK